MIFISNKALPAIFFINFVFAWPTDKTAVIGIDNLQNHSTINDNQNLDLLKPIPNNYSSTNNRIPQETNSLHEQKTNLDIPFDFFEEGISDQKKIHSTPEILDTNLVLPPSWAFGLLYGGYTNQTESIERIKRIISHDYPIDAYWIDSWFWSYNEKGRGPKKYLDFTADTLSYPNRKGMWDFMKSRNIKSGFWIWDCIMQTGNEKVFDEFNSKGFFRNTYIEKGSWHNYSTTTAMHERGENAAGTLCGNIDFENPAAVIYFKEQVKHFFDEGADFIKLDRTSSLPVCKAMFEITQELGKETKGRGFILSHTGGMESEEYKKYPCKWTDDTRADWNIENPTKEFNPWVPSVAFKENIAMFTDPSKESSKIPFLTNDVGGFDIGKTTLVDEELYIRWIQFSMFTPIVEVFSQPENPTSNLAYMFSERADTLFRNYTQLRMKLFPYIYSYAHLRRLTGQQMIRNVNGQLYDYHFGNELLIFPVYEQGAQLRKIFLPEGTWINYWTHKHYDGGKQYVTEAPIETIPIFVRAGSIIPMRKYSSSIERGTNDTLEIHIYPGRNSKFVLIEDDGTSNDYLNGIYASTIFNLQETNFGFQLSVLPTKGSFTGMINERVFNFYIHSNKTVSKVLLNDQENVSVKKEGKNYWLSIYQPNKQNQLILNAYTD